MGYNTAAGSAIAFSAAAPATLDAAGYAALTFTEVGGTEKIGGIGASFAKVEFTPLREAEAQRIGRLRFLAAVDRHRRERCGADADAHRSG
jgi:hypothetical protein